MHRTGLWESRYEVIERPKPKQREHGSAVKTTLGELEAQQHEDRKSLSHKNPRFENELWINYRLLQMFDLLSLYFCCDGHVDESRNDSSLKIRPYKPTTTNRMACSTT